MGVGTKFDPIPPFPSLYRPFLYFLPLLRRVRVVLLPQAINEKPQVVGEYESGKAIPNPQLISKLERALGVRLPRAAKKAKK